MTPISKIVDFPLFMDESKTVRIGRNLSSKLQRQLKTLLIEYEGLFSWQTKELGTVSQNLLEHHLNIPEIVKPIIQKRRFLVAKRQDTIKKEVAKLLEADIIRLVNYAT